MSKNSKYQILKGKFFIQTSDVVIKYNYTLSKQKFSNQPCKYDFIGLHYCKIPITICKQFLRSSRNTFFCFAVLYSFVF